MRELDDRAVCITQRALGVDQPALGVDQVALGVDEPALGISRPLHKRRMLGRELLLKRGLAHSLGFDRSAEEAKRPRQAHHRTRPFERGADHGYPEQALDQVAASQSAHVDGARAALFAVPQRAELERSRAARQQRLEHPLAFCVRGCATENRPVGGIDELARIRAAEVVEREAAFAHELAGTAILHVTSSATTPIECGARPGTTSNVSARSHQS